MDNESRTRLLTIKKILCLWTDEDHPMSTSEIIGRLEKDFGIYAHRITVAKDIECLKENGLDICKIRSSQNQYYVSEGYFDLPELMLLTGAVQTAAFVPDKDKEELLAKFKANISKYVNVKIDRNIALTKHSGCNEKIIKDIIKTVSTAIDEEKKISFKTCRYGKKKEKILQNEDEVIKLSPHTFVCDGKYHYIVGYCENYEKETGFRVDRIADIPVITKEWAKPAPKEIMEKNLVAALSAAYGCEHEKVELICRNDAADKVIDCFGDKISMYSCKQGFFKLVVDLPLCDDFFAWVFAQKGNVVIKGPKKVRTWYDHMLRMAIGAQQRFE